MNSDKTTKKESTPENDDLNEKEKEEALQNGFILVGKTGTGKSTLLNAIFNKVVAQAEATGQSVTKISKVYYYRLKSGKCICLVDTPGLGDTEKLTKGNIDKIHLDGITDTISKAKIHIKGILFLVNFQNKRFDADEQEALLSYNKLFPLKKFWSSLVIIYTHFYPDPNDDDDEEEMMKKRTITNSEIFNTISDKVKEVSDVISYDDLKKKYFNSYSIATNNKKKKLNKKTRDELEILFNELIKNNPLFNRVEIEHIKNHKWKDKDGKEFFGEVEIIGFYDLNDEPIKERLNIITQKEVVKQAYYPPPQYSYTVYDAGYSSSGNLCYQSKEYEKKPNRLARSGGGSLLCGILGAGGAIFIGANPISWATAAGVGIGMGVGALFGLF